MKKLYLYTLDTAPSLVKTLDLHPSHFQDSQAFSNSTSNQLINGRFVGIFSSDRYYYILYKHDLLNKAQEHMTKKELGDLHYANYTTSLIVLNKELDVLQEILLPKEFGYLRYVSRKDRFYFYPNPVLYEEKDFTYLLVGELKIHY